MLNQLTILLFVNSWPWFCVVLIKLDVYQFNGIFNHPIIAIRPERNGTC